MMVIEEEPPIELLIANFLLDFGEVHKMKLQSTSAVRRCACACHDECGAQ